MMWSPAKRRLAIFVKAPRIGQVKTRLGKDIGPVRAARFARRLANKVIGRIARDPRWRTCLWISPDHQAARAGVWPEDVARRGQGQGDLGTRMMRALSACGVGPVVLVGSDIPDLSRGLIEDAFRALECHDVVFGPAKDGGYWLVGVSGMRPVGNLFYRVRWSTAHALADTLANIRPGLCVARLPMLGDVDRLEDLARPSLRQMSL